MTIAKYSDMIAMATRLNDSTKQLNEKCKHTRPQMTQGVGRAWDVCGPSPPPCTDASLQPYLDQIDQIHASVASLEQTAYRLDAYTKQLGERTAGQRVG